MARKVELHLITKDDFSKYEAVRRSGLTNMFDVKMVSELSGLGREMILGIMSNYQELCGMYPDIRTLEKR